MSRKEDAAIEELCNQISQDVSYKLYDLMMSYPDVVRPLAMATVQACITSNLQTMDKSTRDLYETALSKMCVVTIPQSMDPRKKRGPAS